MNGEEMRARLAEAIRASDPHGLLNVYSGERLADAVLPVVRAIVAEELRAAADEAHDEYSGWEAANVVRAHADALEAGS